MLNNVGEGNGNPLQYSCLENPRDREACWAAVYGVAQSRTAAAAAYNPIMSLLATLDSQTLAQGDM